MEFRECQLCRKKESIDRFNGDTASIKQCSRCKLVSYCSKECQSKDWRGHKKECMDSKYRDQWDRLVRWFSGNHEFLDEFFKRAAKEYSERGRGMLYLLTTIEDIENYINEKFNIEVSYISVDELIDNNSYKQLSSLCKEYDPTNSFILAKEFRVSDNIGFLHVSTHILNAPTNIEIIHPGRYNNDPRRFIRAARSILLSNGCIKIGEEIEYAFSEYLSDHKEFKISFACPNGKNVVVTSKG